MKDFSELFRTSLEHIYALQSAPFIDHFAKISILDIWLGSEYDSVNRQFLLQSTNLKVYSVVATKESSTLTSKY